MNQYNIILLNVNKDPALGKAVNAVARATGGC